MIIVPLFPFEIELTVWLLVDGELAFFGYFG
jgi:hypothetical protein